MSIFNWLFKKEKSECPRCLGKGDVDLEDIRRLKKEPFWIPGKCALCRGKGKVTKKVAGSGIEGLGYLTLETSWAERRRLVNLDAGALQRAKQHQSSIDELVKKIERKFYIENMQPPEIAEYLFKDYGRTVVPPEETKELIRYIEKLIKR